MHPLCSCESSALYVSVCLSACLRFCISLLFPLSGHSSFSSTFLIHSVSFASTSTSTSLAFPSVHPSLPSFWTLSIVVTCGLGEGEDSGEETRSVCTAVQPVTTFFIPHIHPDTGLCDITGGLNPQAPRGWAFKTTTRADVDTVVLCTAQDLTFFKSFHEVWAKDEKDAVAYLYSIIVIVCF